MPTGIDAGSRTVSVATPDGVRRYRNGIRRAENDDGESENDEGGGATDNGEATDALRVETDDGVYVVDRGDPAPEGEPIGRLFGAGHGPGDADDFPASVRNAVAEAFLEAVADPPDAPLRYVHGRAGADPLDPVATGLGYDAAPLDPGLAACYDGLEAPATGLGIAVMADRAVATLAAAGVPVATATVDVDGDWYDLGADAAATDGGTVGDWRARQYETLFGELADDLAASAPVLTESIPVAVGGVAAPHGDVAPLERVLADSLPFPVGDVTVAEDPGAALARGALAAADADDAAESPLPAFAVDVPFVAALADYGAATDALGAAARARTRGGVVDVGDDGATDDHGRDGGETGHAGDEGDLGRAVASTRADLATLERRGAMTARGVSDVVDRLDDGRAAGDDDLAALRADLADLESRLPDDEALASLEGDLAAELENLREAVETVQADLVRLEEETATASALADLESSLESLEEDVSRLADDLETVQSAITGLDGEEAPELSAEGVADVQVDAIQADVEEVRADLSDRIEDVWSSIEDLESRLVDVSATADDVPDLESTVESVRNSVDDLEDETADVRSSVSSLRSELDAVREETPSTGDVQAVEADLAQLADDVDSLRTAFEETDWVDPSTVDELETDLEGLRQTLITRADRLQSVEESTRDLRERIETVYQNSAKSEALASLETEAARIRKTAAQAMERTNEMTETVSDLGETVDAHEEELGMVSTNVDNLAGSSVTRNEMQAAIDRVEERVDQLEADVRSDLEGVRSLADQEADVEPVEGGSQDLVVALQAAAFVSLGLFGAILALLSGFPLVAAGFLVFAIMPAVLSWLVS